MRSTGVRRAARELALKVLYQVDVGKLPLEELWDGALDQARLPVDNAIQQAVRQCQTDARSALEAWSGEGLPPSRSMRLTVHGIVGAVRKLGDEARAILGETLSEAPRLTSAGAREKLREAAEAAGAEVDRLAARDRLDADRMRTIADAAHEQIRQLVHGFDRTIAVCRDLTAFSVELVKGVSNRSADIDARLAEMSPGWSQDRQAAVDRNILRLAAYEMMFLPDVPLAATISEAVELAKKYSTAESSKFVNGVLGAMVPERERPEKAEQA